MLLTELYGIHEHNGGLGELCSDWPIGTSSSDVSGYDSHTNYSAYCGSRGKLSGPVEMTKASFDGKKKKKISFRAFFCW